MFWIDGFVLDFPFRLLTLSLSLSPSLPSLPSLPSPAPPSSLPQYKKNALLNARVLSLELDLQSSLAAAEAQSDYNVLRHAAFVEGKEALLSLDSELTAAKGRTVEALEAARGERNDRLARLKLVRDLKVSNFEAYQPVWCKYLQEARAVVTKYGYSNHTKWRTAVGALLLEAAGAFEERNERCGVTGDFRRMAVAFNSYGREEVGRELVELEERGGDVEGVNDPTFRLLREERGVARDAFERAEEEKVYDKESVREEERKKVKLWEEAEGHRRVLGLAGSSDFTKSRGRVDSRKLAKMEATAATKEGLLLALRLPVTRETEAAMEGKYNSLLARCADTGDWFGAVAAYEGMAKRGFVPTKFVFGCIITACKRAEPPQVDRAILVLEEMRKLEVKATIGTYNAVLDCCRVGGEWRKGIQVFDALMREGKVKPNTTTYSVLAKAGFEAKNDDPGEIYAALKFAGVPEYIAYGSAASNALKSEKKVRRFEKKGRRGGKGGGGGRRTLEDELDGLGFVELPYIGKREGEGRGEEEETAGWEIERAVERILRAGGGRLLEGEGSGGGDGEDGDKDEEIGG